MKSFQQLKLMRKIYKVETFMRIKGVIGRHDRITHHTTEFGEDVTMYNLRNKVRKTLLLRKTKRELFDALDAQLVILELMPDKNE